MAFAGLKKQINKANQYMTEKIGGAEGTKLDDDFTEMERKTDVTCELVEELQIKTKEFLHPNPTSRAKMAAVKGISKLSGQAKASTYPQPEGTLGETMSSLGRKLGEDQVLGQSLIEAGEAMKQIADIKYALDDGMKQNFLEPLHSLQSKDLKELLHHRKKLQGRRLDYDCKKRKKERGTHIGEDEIKMAEDKFAESLYLVQMSMHYLFKNQAEQVNQLTTFAESLLDYHRQCVDILSTLHETLEMKKEEAAESTSKEFQPKTLSDLGIQSSMTYHPPTPGNGADAASLSINNASSASPLPSPLHAAATPSCRALFDFEPEDKQELGFKEGDIITLTRKIDENWIEGSLGDKTGHFPSSYVEIIVPPS